MVGRSTTRVALSGPALFVLVLLGSCSSDGGLGGTGGLGGGGSAGGPGGAGGVSAKIGWCAADTIDAGESTAPRDMDMAVDPHGNAIVVWWDYGGDRNVWSNRWTPGEGWGTAERIQTEDGPTLFPRVATDASGNAVAVWAQSDCASTYDIWSRRWTPGEGWGTAERIETEDGYALSPVVAIDSLGNVVAVWTQTDGAGVHSAWSNRWTPEVGWGTPERIQSSDQGARDAQVAVDLDGNAVATWRQRNSENVDELWLNRWTLSEGWDAPERSDATESVGAYHMALDPSGHALVVWSTGYGYSWGSHEDLWSARWTGAWEPAVQVVEHFSTSDPKVVFDANGNAVATCKLGGRVWTGHWTPSDGWGEITEHEGVEAPSSSASPDVAVDRDGDAFLVWEEEDEIWWARWTRSLGWSDAEPIASDDGYVSEPQVKLDADGNAIAVWRSAGLRSSRFDGTCAGNPGAGGTGGDGGASGGGGIGGGGDLCEGVVCPDTECRSGGACNPDDGACTYATDADDGTACSEGACLAGGCGQIGAFPCTEQGIRDAIAEGGGPHFFACDETVPIVLAETIVIDNDVVLDGEGELVLDPLQTAISVVSPASVELRAIRVIGDSLGYIVNSGNLTVIDSTVKGVASNNGVLTIIDTEVRGIEVGITGGVATLTRTRISAPESNPHPVAIFNSSATTTVTDSTISGPGDPRVYAPVPYWGNTAIRNLGNGLLILENTTISGNASAYAGAIQNGGTMTLTNSTVSGNIALRGPSIENQGTMTITNSTVSGGAVAYACSSNFNGYGIGNSGTLTVTNSTVAANAMGGLDNRGEMTVTNSVIDGDCVQFGLDAATFSGGHNLVGGSDTCGFDDPTDLTDVSSLALALGPLADNGGPTMTHALLPGSVAIDTIPTLMCEVAEDQRGEPRPAGAICDVGAFEVQP